MAGPVRAIATCLAGVNGVGTDQFGIDGGGSILGGVECTRMAYGRCRRAGFDHQTCLDIVGNAILILIDRGLLSRPPHERCKFLQRTITILIHEERRRRRHLSLEVEGTGVASGLVGQNDPLLDERILEIIDFAIVQLTDAPERLRAVFLIYDRGRKGHQHMGCLGAASTLAEVATILGISTEQATTFSTQSQTQFSELFLGEAERDAICGPLVTEDLFNHLKLARDTPVPQHLTEAIKRVWAVFLRATQNLPESWRVPITIVRWCRRSHAVARQVAGTDISTTIKDVDRTFLQDAEEIALGDEVLSELGYDELRRLLSKEYSIWAR
jgi:hypothetical protein